MGIKLADRFALFSLVYMRKILRPLMEEILWIWDARARSYVGLWFTRSPNTRATLVLKCTVVLIQSRNEVYLKKSFHFEYTNWAIKKYMQVFRGYQLRQRMVWFIETDLRLSLIFDWFRSKKIGVKENWGTRKMKHRANES